MISPSPQLNLSEIPLIALTETSILKGSDLKFYILLNESQASTAELFSSSIRFRDLISYPFLVLSKNSKEPNSRNLFWHGVDTFELIPKKSIKKVLLKQPLESYKWICPITLPSQGQEITLPNSKSRAVKIEFITPVGVYSIFDPVIFKAFDLKIGSNLEYLVKKACENGSIIFLRWIKETTLDFQFEESHIVAAASSDQLLLLEYFKRLGLLTDAIIRDLVSTACSSNQISILQYFYDRCILHHDRKTLIPACANGHLDVLNWWLSHSNGITLRMEWDKDWDSHNSCFDDGDWSETKTPTKWCEALGYKLSSDSKGETLIAHKDLKKPYNLLTFHHTLDMISAACSHGQTKVLQWFFDRSQGSNPIFKMIYDDYSLSCVHEAVRSVNGEIIEYGLDVLKWIYIESTPSEIWDLVKVHKDFKKASNGSQESLIELIHKSAISYLKSSKQSSIFWENPKLKFIGIFKIVAEARYNRRSQIYSWMVSHGFTGNVGNGSKIGFLKKRKRDN